MPSINQPTRYEVTATHPDGRVLLVSYTRRLSRSGLADVIRARGLVLAQALGVSPDTPCYLHMAPRIHSAIGPWTVGYTGRTQREAMQAGAHPYYEAALAAKAA